MRCVLLTLRAALLPRACANSERMQWTCKQVLNNQAMRKQQLTGQIQVNRRRPMKKTKLKRIRLSHAAGRGFGDELDRTRVRGERPGGCTCSNFQAKSPLFSFLPTAALNGTYFDNHSVLVIFQARRPNICWIQLLKCEGLMLYFVIHSMTFRFCTVGWTKQAIRIDL